MDSALQPESISLSDYGFQVRDLTPRDGNKVVVRVRKRPRLC
jgi:hypothetical protein